MIELTSSTRFAWKWELWGSNFLLRVSLANSEKNLEWRTSTNPESATSCSWVCREWSMSLLPSSASIASFLVSLWSANDMLVYWGVAGVIIILFCSVPSMEEVSALWLWSGVRSLDAEYEMNLPRYYYSRESRESSENRGQWTRRPVFSFHERDSFEVSQFWFDFIANNFIGRIIVSYLPPAHEYGRY